MVPSRTIELSFLDPLCFILFHLFLEPKLDPPPNLTAVNSSSSSLVIRWKPYVGEATLLGYRVLVLDQGRREHRAKRALTILHGELIKNFSVGANVTMVEIGNLSTFSKYCIRIGVIAVEGNGELSNCSYFYTDESKL